MQADIIMVRYGELSTKGRNKNTFIQLLGKNIRHALKKYSSLKYEILHDHIYIHLNGEKYEDVALRLKDVSGILSFSPVYRVNSDIENIKACSLNLAREENKNTFKVKSHRADKEFPICSDDVNRLVAGEILRNTSYKVDVHNPELLISITIRDEYTYIYAHEDAGAGGYPLGIGGKSLMMISGGIDSPVAAYLMMKRGVKIECIHFASPPYTSQKVIDKINDLLHVLNNYQSEIKLYIVPFTHLQEEIYKNVPVSYAITIMRRMMYRIAERVARYHNDLVISNGESIGQVASQTLNSIQTIETVCHMPVIRPLAIYDKLDIIKIARNINTFDISIRPYEDCCTIFEVKDPSTHPLISKCEEYEAKFDYEALIKECIDGIEAKYISEDNKDSLDNLL